MDGFDAWSIEAIATEFFSDLVAEPVGTGFDVNGENTGFECWTIADLSGDRPVWTKPTFKIIPSWASLKARWKKR